jgi:hypothetical protein
MTLAVMVVKDRRGSQELNASVPYADGVPDPRFAVVSRKEAKLGS